MTEFLDLELDWNRGSSWTPPAAPADWSPFAAVELPLTEGVHLARGYAARKTVIADALAHGCFVFASHVISADNSPEEQAAAVAAALTGAGLPASTPLLILPPPIPRQDSLALILQTVWDLTGQGLNPRVVYVPEYYWRVIGCPDLYTMCRNNHMALISEPQSVTWTLDEAGSLVPGYPGDDSPQWAGYGGFRDDEVPFLRVPAESFAAYRGTRDQLAALLAPVASAAPVAAVVPPPTSVEVAPAAPAAPVAEAAPADPGMNAPAA